MTFEAFAFVCCIVTGDCEMLIHKTPHQDLNTCMESAMAIQIDLFAKYMQVGKFVRITTGCRHPVIGKSV